MKEEIIMAGFGGQGIMFMGKLLAHAGMQAGVEVSWIPSYGPEMRGGTANCTVILSSKQIASPLTSRPDTIIVMNQPSLDKFAVKVKKGGSIFINSSLVKGDITRDDVDVKRIPVNEIALDLGNSQVANLVMLGAYIAKKANIELTIIKESLSNVLPLRRHHYIPINEKALEAGANFI